MTDTPRAAREIPRLLPRTFAGLFLLQGALLLLFVVLYKTAASPIYLLPPNKFGYAAGGSCLAGLLGAVLLILDVRRYHGSRSIKMSVSLNVVVVVVLFAVIEIGTRVMMLAAPDLVNASLPRGLLPRTWSEEVQLSRWKTYREKDRAALDSAFVVFDERLGWTIGASRSSGDGMYSSSSEGIRASDSSVRYRDTRPEYRIALVGDSYTLGSSVSFEDTWGYRLEQLLGDGFQVLNFGVGAYGVGQAYLRYLEDVRSWQPDVVIFGVISHDLLRTFGVYVPIAHPKWEIPFAKPRFTMKDDGLSLVNVPVPSPDELLARSAVGDFPHIDLETGYYAPEWRRRWYHRSFALRLIQSIFPNWPDAETPVESIRRLNGAILHEFQRTVKADGGEPVLVFFSSHGAGELRAESSKSALLPGRGKDVLAYANLEYFDSTECVFRVPQDERLAPDGVHYSAAANAEISECLRELLMSHVVER